MKLPVKINEREKRVLIIGGLVVLLIGAFQAYTWYVDFKKKADDFLEAKRFVLEKQLNKISGKDEAERRINKVKLELEDQEKTLLQGDKPPVAAAALQKALKDTASSLSITISSERILNPTGDGFYVGVPVEIGFTASTEKLRDFLFKLRNAPFLIRVTEIKVRVMNISNPTDIYTTLIATGFIKKQAEPETKSKEAKDAA
ncbi:MAG: hypothetical protein HZA14_07700 [Nitrospirae bacterium]|nr:hypothetical protein [Nitrospirota bacterium]